MYYLLNLLETEMYRGIIKTNIMRLNPCIEDLNSMTPNESGRFCGSCNKNIVDLTEKSNEEIQQLYLANNGELCGIVLPNQLTERKYYHPLKRFAFALMLVFGSSLFVFASELVPHIDNLRSKILTEATALETSHTIKGFVYHDGKVLTIAEVSVVVGDKVYKARTDAQGQFILQLPEMSSKEVVLVVSSVGYETIYKNISLTSSSIFIGKITLEKSKVENCVKGKIAPNVHRTAGVIALPEPVEKPQIIQTKGEVSPVGGGIEKPKEDSIFD